MVINMDKIYSRKRIRLPKIIFNSFNFQSSTNTNNKKNLKFIAIITVAIVTFTMAINGINPIFEKLCSERAKSLATIICNEESTKIIKNYKYEDLVTIYKDSNENITMIKSNINVINLMISDIGEKIQKRLNEVEKDEIGIHLGSFTATKLLSAIGPIIPVKLATTGNIQTDLRSEFKEAGINQTMHRIYLQIDCEVNILTPYNIITEKISNQVLIAENIIVGKIPDSYYNLNGLNTEEAMNLVE